MPVVRHLLFSFEGTIIFRIKSFKLFPIFSLFKKSVLLTDTVFLPKNFLILTYIVLGETSILLIRTCGTNCMTKMS